MATALLLVSVLLAAAVVGLILFANYLHTSFVLHATRSKTWSINWAAVRRKRSIVPVQSTSPRPVRCSRRLDDNG
jgi:hypothetical protein